ncbi:MAG: UDP-N-acetylglucosamine pyrophosphorylase [Spirochaetota bacterium]
MSAPRSMDFLDLQASLASEIIDPLGPPWLALPLLAALIAKLLRDPPPGYTLLAPGILMGTGCTISARAELVGPAVIGPGSEIRTGAYIRENVLVGAHCVVGNSTELKACILFDGSQAPHFSYIGDSILGARAHLGAGVILSNYRNDHGAVRVRIAGGADIATGLAKFGSVIGDDVEIGCNSVCYPGTLVGRGSSAYPLSALRGIVPQGVIVKADGSVIPRSGG